MKIVGDIEDRYYELDNFLSVLRNLKDDLVSKDLIAEIDNLLLASGYDDEFEHLGNLLEAESEQELQQRNREYWGSQF